MRGWGLWLGRVSESLKVLEDLVEMVDGVVACGFELGGGAVGEGFADEGGHVAVVGTVADEGGFGGLDAVFFEEETEVADFAAEVRGGEAPTVETALSIEGEVCGGVSVTQV